MQVSLCKFGRGMWEGRGGGAPWARCRGLNFPVQTFSARDYEESKAVQSSPALWLVLKCQSWGMTHISFNN